MNMKIMPKRITMYPLSKCIYVPVIILLSIFSNGDCGCTFKGSGDVYAECTDVFPDLSSFSPSNVNHLNVYHAKTLPVFQLSSSQFLDQPKLKYLRSIIIHNTTLISIDKHAFGGLAYLDYIDISDNSLFRFIHQDSVSDLIGLKILLLSGNVHLFKQITGPILVSDSLEELDLSRCKIEYLHNDAFKQLKQLTYLNLANNQIRRIPPAIFSGLNSLVELDLSENFLSGLPWYMLQNSSAVEDLKLRGNPISYIPKDIFSRHGNSITHLDLSDTELTSINIPSLYNLEKLDLGGSLVSSPINFSKFPELTYLNLSYTKLTKVDSNSFENNSRLETIILSNNNNISLPHYFDGSFFYTYLLDISNCGLDYLAPTFFRNMRAIVTLNLSHNAFSDSKSLGQALNPLDGLEVLDLTNNKIKSIGEEDFSGQHILKKLILSQNPLTSPPSLANMPVLRVIDLSQCELKRIHLPAIFRQVIELEYISLSGNNLSSLNDEVYLDPNEDENSPWDLPDTLSVLDLNDNPWSCDPSFISLIDEVNKLGVAPSDKQPEYTEPFKSSYRNLDKEWGQLVDRACERANNDIQVTLETLNLPPVLEGTVMPKFPIWLTVGISAAVLLASAIVIYKLFHRNVSHQQTSKGLMVTNTDGVKINVCLVSAASGMKIAARAKDYQRLKEDVSPGLPETPRIYRPPVNGSHFTFPEIPDGTEPKDCD